MKRAAFAVGAIVRRIAMGVGLEGSFLALGTGLLAVAASYVAPVGPLVVVGVACVIYGVALAVPAGRE